MFKKNILATLMLLPALGMANGDLKPMLQIGYDWGGKTLATVQRPYEVDQTINAGEGLSLEGGAVAEFTPNFEMQFLVGYKYDGITEYNGEVTWDTIPFTATAMFKKNRWKFGGGVTYHVNPHLSGKFTGYDSSGNYFEDAANDRYDNALGGVIQVQYMATNNFSVGVKGTFIEYQLQGDASQKARGDSFGFNLSYAFGERSEFR